MKYSVSCLCGYETPLVDNIEEVDYDLLDMHTEECKIWIKNYIKPFIGLTREMEIRIRSEEE